MSDDEKYEDKIKRERLDWEIEASRRIEKLERMQETILETDPCSMQDDIKELKEKIEELEKIVQDRKEYDLYLAKRGLIEQMIIRYAELKERQKKGEDWVQSLLDLGWNNRKVLRELGEDLKKACEYDWNGQEIKITLKHNLEVLLAKLDGKIKYCEHGTPSNIHCLKCLEGSGGEKVLETETVNKHERVCVHQISTDSKPPEPKYLCLKLSKQLDIIKLRNLLDEIIDGDNALGLSVSWFEVSEALLKADGSWDKRPELYPKYNVRGFKEPSETDTMELIHKDDIKELISEFVEDLKYAVNSYLEVDTVTDKYIKILIEKWEARTK